MIYFFVGHRPAILHQKSKNLATTTVCQGYSCTFKRAIVCYYSSFTRKAMIVNKQACKSSNIGLAKIEKTDSFSTSAEISQLLLSGNVPLELIVTIIAQLAIQVYCILLILEFMLDCVCHVEPLYTVHEIWHNFQNQQNTVNLDNQLYYNSNYQLQRNIT